MPFTSFLWLLGFIAFGILFVWIVFQAHKANLRYQERLRRQQIELALRQEMKDQQILREISARILRENGETP